MPDFVTLEPAMKFKTFIKEVYKPIIKDAVNERKGTYIADLETFDKGGVITMKALMLSVLPIFLSSHLCSL